MKRLFVRMWAAEWVWLAAALLAATPALALDVKSEQSAAGVWRLSQGAGRECTIQLRAETRGRGRAVGMPPGCRHTMPGVAKVASWKLPAPGQLEFTDQGGASVLAFSLENGELGARGPKGEYYALVAANEPRRAQHETQQASVSRGPSVPAGEIPGRYSILRETNKDTGCMLTLQPGGKAQLAPACRDNGIVVFDPVTWSYAGGKLMLRARKGHHANFEYTSSDQSWQKDPRDGGKKLGFRKM